MSREGQVVTKSIRKTGFTQYECLSCGNLTYSTNPKHIYKECEICRATDQDYTDEIWEKVVGSDRYEVSSYGRCRGINGILKQTIRDGYKTVDLTINRKSKTHRVHRLVCAAFHPNLKEKPYVNHIDGDRGNNKASNLEWITPKGNSQHAIHMLGRKNTQAIRMTDTRTGEVNYFPNMSEAARRGGGSPAHIKEVMARPNIYPGYKYEFVNHQEYVDWGNRIGLFNRN